MCVVIFTSLLQAKEHMRLSSDELIMRGLLYDEYEAYSNAREVYAKLFDTTQEEAYLFKEATSSLLGKTHIYESIKRLKLWEASHAIEKPEVQRLLIPLYLSVNQINSAKIQAEYLLEHSTKPMDLELAANSFLYSGEYTRALELLNKVYKSHPSEMILLKMTDIMDGYTHERKQAIQLLESYHRMHITSNDVFAKLLILYSKEKNIEGLLQTYKTLYKRDENKKVLAKIIDSYLYKKDIAGAITFLEEQHVENELLYDLYKMQKSFDKALLIAEHKYKKNKDARWLAEKAILLFENAKNKDDKMMLESVVSIFEKALGLGVDDSIYLNYYGYTLIDKEIDIKKGMHIIQNALLQQPNNTYYLDSLAWGYFKQHECSQAYTLMKRIVDTEGVKEDEIKEHWDAIKQCK